VALRRWCGRRKRFEEELDSTKREVIALQTQLASAQQVLPALLLSRALSLPPSLVISSLPPAREGVRRVVEWL